MAALDIEHAKIDPRCVDLLPPAPAENGRREAQTVFAAGPMRGQARSDLRPSQRQVARPIGLPAVGAQRDRGGP
jgi:hypothetical protein